MEKMENPFCPTDSISSLLCQESDTSCFGEDQEDPSLISLTASNGFSDLEEYVQLLLEKEKINSSYVLTTCNFTTNDRLKAINYILNTRELLGFELETAYLSVTYLDRFLSLRTLEGEKPWAMQLLSIGCLSLAAKMQESIAWGLSSFQGGEVRFDVKAIQKMEILIMYTLEWKLGSITPFAFLAYFIDILFAKPPPWSTLTMLLELVIAFMKGVNLMDHYPSAIALAAVLMSLDQRLTRNSMESKINGIPCSRFLDLDDVVNCYQIMSMNEQSKMSTTTRMVGFQHSSCTHSISSKRQRLTFDEIDDPSQGLTDDKQQPGGSET